MSYPVLNTPNIVMYSRNKVQSIIGYFEVTPPEDFGTPENVSMISQHRFMMYLYIFQYDCYIALAYLNTIWGDYSNGNSNPPTDTSEVQEVLSFNVGLDSVRQLVTPPEAYDQVTILTDDYWPDYINGETEDNWTPPSSPQCNILECISISTDWLGFTEEDFSSGDE